MHNRSTVCLTARSQVHLLLQPKAFTIAKDLALHGYNVCMRNSSIPPAKSPKAGFFFVSFYMISISPSVKHLKAKTSLKREHRCPSHRGLLEMFNWYNQNYMKFCKITPSPQYKNCGKGGGWDPCLVQIFKRYSHLQFPLIYSDFKTKVNHRSL